MSFRHYIYVSGSGAMMSFGTLDGRRLSRPPKHARAPTPSRFLTGRFPACLIARAVRRVVDSFLHLNVAGQPA